MTDKHGVCFFAYNNAQFDYIKLAVYAAKQVKKHLGLPVALITDHGGEGWLTQSHDSAVVDENIDYIVISEDEMKNNVRGHFDSPWTEFRAQFNNSNKHRVFDYSPFDKTLLLDIDYLVRTNFLLYSVTFNDSPVVMFNDSLTLRNNPSHRNERWLWLHGIPMWWSTVIQFDKSETSKIFFDTWAHVAENYEYYQYLYNFPGKLFRTDYCVSIATHIMNGFKHGNAIDNFGVPIMNMSQKDDIIHCNTNEEWIYLAHDPKEPWKNILVNSGLTDIHVMNKRAMERAMDGNLVGIT